MERSGSLQLSRRQVGPLDCTVFSPREGTSPNACVILCHGFGAPGTDLVPLASDLATLAHPAAANVSYYFPQAPLSLESFGFGEGRAWWMIDIERYQRAMQSPQELERLRREVPAGMPESSQMLRETVEHVLRETGLPLQRILLGGFSQGSMVAVDVALRLAERPAGLLIFSGTLLAEREWTELAKKRGPLPVLQTHGLYDQILPFSAAESLRDLFVASGFDVTFLPFPGPHTIPLEALHQTARLVAALAT